MAFAAALGSWQHKRGQWFETVITVYGDCLWDFARVSIRDIISHSQKEGVER